MKQVTRAALIVPLFAVTHLRAQDIRLSRKLLHSTVRIETLKSDGAHVGTGFFYLFARQEGGGGIPCIVTCAHLISGATDGRLYFSVRGEEPFKRKAPIPPLQLPQFEKLWIKHPDGKTDLAVFPVLPFMTLLKNAGATLDIIPFDDTILPTEKELSESSVFVDIKMIGYPIGIWDAHHNLPVVRRGMTATDLTVDYNGRPEFLVDTAIFPGSSGSPILIAEEGARSYGVSYMRVPDQLRLLGIVYAQHQFTATGGVEVVTVPSAFDMKARTSVPANLALVIKAEKLREFEPVLKKLAGIQEKEANKPSEATP